MDTEATAAIMGSAAFLRAHDRPVIVVNRFRQQLEANETAAAQPGRPRFLLQKRSVKLWSLL